jgi:hypothetical protein
MAVVRRSLGAFYADLVASESSFSRGRLQTDATSDRSCHLALNLSSPPPSAQHFSFVEAREDLFEPGAIDTEIIDLIQHSLQQLFR